jgi:hypothetical protein
MEKYNKFITPEQITELIGNKSVEPANTKRYKKVLTQYLDTIYTLHTTYELSYLQIHKFLQNECGIKCTYLTLLNFINNQADDRFSALKQN